uniref:Uncharacterized protein n=1 Tax=Glossina pallidipes TaxID=7398 RepID=A0A1A9ZHH7_GLOPL
MQQSIVICPQSEIHLVMANILPNVIIWQAIYINRILTGKAFDESREIGLIIVKTMGLVGRYQISDLQVATQCFKIVQEFYTPKIKVPADESTNRKYKIKNL